MEQSPSLKANRFTASQKIPCILWNPKLHYCSHKCPSPVPILSQLDPVHTPTSYFLKIHINIILPSMPGPPKWFLPSSFPAKTWETNSLYARYTVLPQCVETEGALPRKISLICTRNFSLSPNSLLSSSGEDTCYHEPDVSSAQISIRLCLRFYTSNTSKSEALCNSS